MQESIVFLVRVQCRCKESSRSLSHLLMSFLYLSVIHSSVLYYWYYELIERCICGSVTSRYLHVSCPMYICVRLSARKVTENYCDQKLIQLAVNTCYGKTQQKCFKFWCHLTLTFDLFVFLNEKIKLP